MLNKQTNCWNENEKMKLSIIIDLNIIFKSLKLYYLNICFLLFWCLKNSENENENNIYKDLNIIKLSIII